MKIIDDYLIRALVVSIGVGIMSSFVGLHLAVRRLTFLGLVIPQVSTLGAAITLWIVCTLASSVGHLEEKLCFPWAITLGGALVITIPTAIWLGNLTSTVNKPKELSLGVVYSAALGGVLLLMTISPHGLHHIPELFKGQILTVGWRDLIQLYLAISAILAILIFNHRKLFVCGIDPEFATAVGYNLKAIETQLLVLASIAISIGAITVGPILTFAYAACPIFAAWLFSNSHRSFVISTLLLALMSGITGTVLAFWLDLPVGTTHLLVLSSITAICFGISRIFPRTQT